MESKLIAILKISAFLGVTCPEGKGRRRVRAMARSNSRSR